MPNRGRQLSRTEYAVRRHIARRARYRCVTCGELITECSADCAQPAVTLEAFVHVLAKNGAADFDRAEMFQLRYMAAEREVDLRDTTEIAMQMMTEGGAP